MSTPETLSEKVGRYARATVFGAFALGGTIAGGVGGYRLGEYFSSDATEGLATVVSRAVEAAPTLGGAVVGAAAGVFIGVWAADGDFDTTTE